MCSVLTINEPLVSICHGRRSRTNGGIGRVVSRLGLFMWLSEAGCEAQR